MTKNFVLLLIVALLVFINFFSFVVIIPMYVLDVNGGEFHVGLQNTVFYAAAIVLRGYFGPLADTRGRRLPLLIGIFAFATASLLFLISDSLITIYLIRIYQATGLAAFFSTGGSLVGDMAPPGKNGLYMGSYRFVNTLALLIGPGIAVSVINLSSYGSWFVLGALIGLVAFVLAFFIKFPSMSDDKEDEQLSIIDSFKQAFTMENASVIFFATGITAFSLGILQTFASIFTEQVTDIANPGLYFTLFGLAGIVSNVIAGYLTDISEREKIPWIFLILMGIGMFIFAFLPHNTVFFILSSLLAGFGFGGGITSLFTWTIEVAGEKLRATALSIQESAIDISIAIGSFLFGLLVAGLDYSLSFILVGIAVAALGGVFMKKFVLSN